MYLVARQLHHRHFRKHLHIFAVARDKTVYSFFTLRALDAELASSEHKAGSKALQVPLEWSADGFVEVVDVEDEPSIRSGVCAQIAHVCVTADLVHNPRMRQQRKVCGHDRNRATKEAEGRCRHAL